MTSSCLLANRRRCPAHPSALCTWKSVCKVDSPPGKSNRQRLCLEDSFESFRLSFFGWRRKSESDPCRIRHAWAFSVPVYFAPWHWRPQWEEICTSDLLVDNANKASMLLLEAVLDGVSCRITTLLRGIGVMPLCRVTSSSMLTPIPPVLSQSRIT